MCVIFFKPSGVSLPKTLDMKKMFWDNDDGLGFMRVKDGVVIGKKFHTLEEFLSAIYQVPKKCAVVGHFRTATHGGRTIDFAQPFPFPVKSKRDLHAQEWVADTGVAHNGVLSGFGDSMYGQNNVSYYIGTDGKKRRWSNGKWVLEEGTATPVDDLKLSDTQDFLWFLSNTRSLNRAVAQQDAAVFALLKRLVSSKWAFMNKSGKVRIIGTWSSTNGLWYSNLFWQTKTDPAIPYKKPVDTTDVAVGYQRGGFGGHFRDTKALPVGSNDDFPTEGAISNENRDWRNILAESECANWDFCTKNGAAPGKCIGSGKQNCMFFEESVLPAQGRNRNYLGG